MSIITSLLGAKRSDVSRTLRFCEKRSIGP